MNGDILLNKECRERSLGYKETFFKVRKMFISYVLHKVHKHF